MSFFIALQVALMAPEVVEEDVGIVSVCLNITGEPDTYISSTAVFMISTQNGSASAGWLYSSLFSSNRSFQ